MSPGSAIGLFLLATVACTAPGSAGQRYARFTRPAGSRIVSVDVRRHREEHSTIEGTRKRWKHLGVLAIDLETHAARNEGGVDEPYEAALLMGDASGRSSAAGASSCSSRIPGAVCSVR